MAKQFNFQSGTNPNGTNVMGVTLEGLLFKGNIIGIANHNECGEVALNVKGISYNGSKKKSFKMELPLEIIKIYDEKIFVRLKKLICDYAIAIENVNYYQSTILELLS